MYRMSTPMPILPMKLHNTSESGDDSPLRVLGIDPGSRITGFGVITVYGNQLACVDRGCIRTGDGEFPARLQQIFSGISAVIDRHQPQQVAIEDVFVGRNVASALKLGQARGVAMGACLSRQLPVAEYAARQGEAGGDRHRCGRQGAGTAYGQGVAVHQ